MMASSKRDRQSAPPVSFGHVWSRIRRAAGPLAAGAVGSLAAIVVMGILRLTWGTLTLPELLAERILPLMSAQDFVAFLLRFHPHPKTTPLGLAVLGQFALGVALGPLLNHLAGSASTAPGRWPSRRVLYTGVGVALGMELVAIVLFWPVLPAGLYGYPLDQARLLTIASLALTFGAYVLVTQLFIHWFRQHAALTDINTSGVAENRVSMRMAFTRRGVLRTTGIAVIAIAAEAVAVNRLIEAYLARSNLSYEGRSTPGMPPAPITPAQDFYVVSKNVLDPTVDVSRWHLEVVGLVEHPLTLTYREVLALPSERRAVTLECISNEVGGHLVSTGNWAGATLQTILDRAHVQPAGTHVVFHSVDGYITSLPLRDLLKAQTLLAWHLNGVPLPDRHGFPLRAVVPGRYGEQSAKWLTRIEITNHEVKGFYQSQGWSAAPLETMSRIDSPGNQVTLGAVTVAGIAFAGTRGIAHVEVSTDGGRTWSDATLTPPLSDQSWVFWTWTWQPESRGVYTLVARATDSLGHLQTGVRRGTVPDGATGWHQVTVRVV